MQKKNGARFPGMGEGGREAKESPQKGTMVNTIWIEDQEISMAKSEEEMKGRRGYLKPA